MAVKTKSTHGKNLPASAFLVVGDPETVGTWHLPVRGEDGKPDPALMGAAHAALTAGFMGNVYQGPDKDKALAELKKLYAQMKMAWPEDSVSHSGVLGMKWGHRKGDTGSSGNSSYDHKLHWSKKDTPVGRDSYGVFDKHKTKTQELSPKGKAVVDYLTGYTNAKILVSKTPFLKKKYSSLSSEDKIKMEKKAHKVLLAISGIALAKVAYDIAKLG